MTKRAAGLLISTSIVAAFALTSCGQSGSAVGHKALSPAAQCDSVLVSIAKKLAVKAVANPYGGMPYLQSAENQYSSEFHKYGDSVTYDVLRYAAEVGAATIGGPSGKRASQAASAALQSIENGCAALYASNSGNSGNTGDSLCSGNSCNSGTSTTLATTTTAVPHPNTNPVPYSGTIEGLSPAIQDALRAGTAPGSSTIPDAVIACGLPNAPLTAGTVVHCGGQSASLGNFGVFVQLASPTSFTFLIVGEDPPCSDLSPAEQAALDAYPGNATWQC